MMKISELVAEMSLEEKVGQMFMLAFAGKQFEDVRGMLQDHYVGGCYISQDNADTPEEAQTLSNTLQGFARATRHSIPLVLGADQEGAWGVLVPSSTTGPGNLALGAAHTPEITQQMHQVIGAELQAVGYNTLLAPCADVNSNPLNPIIGTRSFGENPQQVADHTVAAIKGARAGGAITTVKHFPGHGDTSEDSHRGLPRVDRNRAELEQMDFFPFQQAIQAGVDIVMTAHILYPALDAEYPATLSKAILQDLLRQQMGFQGVILSDSMNMHSMRKNYAPDEAAVLAVLAGVDMIMLAEEHYEHDTARYLEQQVTTMTGVIDAVKSGRIPMELIDSAVERILKLKQQYGLFERETHKPDEAKLVGSSENRAVAAKASEAAVTLVRDRSQLWPLSTAKPIVLVNATPRPAYDILTQTRGIGPNQNQPAFDVFKEELFAQGADVTLFSHEDIQSGTELPQEVLQADAVVVVTEDYPLPGIDFDTASQKALVKRLEAQLGERMLVVGLRIPYELAEYPQVSTYISPFSSRPCAAAAAARALLGQIPAPGQAPVTVV